MAKISVIGQRVRRRMADLNITTVKELEQMAGLPRDSVRHLVAGRTTSMRSGKLPALATALKMTVEELVAGTSVVLDPAAVLMSVALQSTPMESIGRMKVDASALSAFGASPSSALRWLVASGDNMAPTIERGDVVLVDSAVNIVAQDGIFAMRAGEYGIALRRVQITAAGDSVIIGNDNPKYSPESGVSLDSLKVLGRVIGIYRKA